MGNKKPHEWFREMLIRKSKELPGKTDLGKVLKTSTKRDDIIKQLLK